MVSRSPDPPVSKVRQHDHPTRKGVSMKIKSNLRAGKGGGNDSSSKNSKSINNTVVSYVPPTSRCVGI
jgi:hypothetical protein